MTTRYKYILYHTNAQLHANAAEAPFHIPEFRYVILLLNGESWARSYPSGLAYPLYRLGARRKMVGRCMMNI